MPRKKAEPAAAPDLAAAVPVQAAMAAPPAASRRSSRKKPVASAPLLDLAEHALETASAAAAPPASGHGSVPEPVPEPVSEPVAVAEPAPDSEPVPAPEPAAVPEPVVVPKQVVVPEPVVVAEPEPVPEPAPVEAATPAAPPTVPAESMADRAVRYRQRFLQDDKPLARRPPPPPVAPPPRLRAEPEPGQGPRKALSMADIAERQRAARSAAREPEVRAVAPQRPATESMQDRALRFRPAAPDETPAKAAAPAPIAQRPGRAPDGLERAAHATHHRPADSSSSAPAVALDTPSGRAVGVALVLVARNHGPVIAARLAAWRQVVPEVDVRLAVLDLGSTDDTVATVEEDAAVTVASCPGGLADPLVALAVAVRALPADVAVLVQADHPPGPRGVALVQAARTGGVTAWQAIVDEGVLVVPAAALRKVVLPQTSLAQWAREAGVAAPAALHESSHWRRGFVVALLGRAPRRRDRVLALLPTLLRPMAGRLAGLLAGP